MAPFKLRPSVQEVVFISELLGTLGDNKGFLTCSMHIAKKRMPNLSIEPFPTFEEAIFALKKGKVSFVVVPAAYSLINNFIMDNEIETKDVFIEKIPSLVMVSKKGLGAEQQKKISKVYLHSATTKLLEEIAIQSKNLTIHYVDSNIEACELLISSNDLYSTAITNLLCAKYFNLNVIKILRESVNMPWVMFAKKKR